MKEKLVDSQELSGKKVPIYALIMFVGFLTGSIFSPCRAEKIVNFSFETIPEAVRLNFNVEGGFPQKVDTKTIPKITVTFKELQIEEPVRKSLKTAPSIVDKINLVEGVGGHIEILLADKKAQVEYLILPVVDTKQAGTYRLVIDIVPSYGAAVTLKTIGPPMEKLLEEEAKKLEKEKPSTVDQKETARSLKFPEEVAFEEMFFVEANKAYNHEDYERAVNLYRRYVERAKGEHINEARLGLALSLYKLREDELAQFGNEVSEALQEALDLLPNDPRAPLARCFLASVFFKTGMRKRSQNILEELLKTPVSGDVAICAWKTLGEIYLKQGQYIEAVRAFHESTKFGPGPKEAALISMLMGKTLSEGGAYRQALVQLRKALDFYPALYLEYPEFLKTLGETLFGMRDYEGALKTFLWYLNLSPKAPSDDMLWAYIAETLIQTSKEAIAERIQNNIIVNMPDSEGGYLSLLRKAQKLEEKGKTDQALAIYEELGTKSLPEALAFINYFRWALLLKNRKRFEDALAKIDEFIKNSSTKKEAVYTLDDFFDLKREIFREWLLEEYRNANYQKVVELYNKHRGEFSEEGPILEAISISFYREKDCSVALEFLEKLIVTVPRPSKDWLIAAAYCAYTTGELEKAEMFFRQVPDLDKEHSIIFARLLMIRKKFPEARKILEKLIHSQEPGKETAFLLIDCLIEQKDWPFTLQFITNTAEKIPDLSQEERFRLLKVKIQSLEALKRMPELIDRVTEAINLAPTQDEKCLLTYKLYNLYLSTGQQTESENTLRELSRCEIPFWKRVGEEGLRYLEFLKKTEGVKKTSEVKGRP